MPINTNTLTVFRIHHEDYTSAVRRQVYKDRLKVAARPGTGAGRSITINSLTTPACLVAVALEQHGTRLHHFARLSSEYARSRARALPTNMYAFPDAVHFGPARATKRSAHSRYGKRGVIEIRTIGYGGALPERTK